MYLYLPNLLPTSLKKNNNAQATSTTNSSYAPTLLCLLIYLNQRACISNNVYFLPKFFVIKIYTYTYGLDEFTFCTYEHDMIVKVE